MTSHRHRSGAESRSPQFELKGTVTVVGDIVGPILPENDWSGLADVQPSPSSAGEADSGSERTPDGGST